MSPLSLHTKFTELVKSERKITQEVLLCIQLIDLTKAYAELGYSSLFDYLTRGQKYSEGSAQRRISAARVLKELPATAAKIQDGNINLTQLAKLAIAVKQEQKNTGTKVSTKVKQDLINLIENKNTLETEKLLGEELNYKPVPKEKITARHTDVFLDLRLTQNQYEKLVKAKALLSHSHHEANLSEVIEVLCDKLIKAKTLDQNPKALKRGQSSAIVTAKPLTIDQSTAKIAVFPTAATAVNPSPRKTPYRPFIPASTRKRIFNKAQHCCEYQSPITGEKCCSRYQLQIDHIKPLAKGGGSHPENLRVLCRAHNLTEARRWGLFP